MPSIPNTEDERHAIESSLRGQLQEAIIEYCDARGMAPEIVSTCKNVPGMDAETLFIYEKATLDNPWPGHQVGITRIRVDIVAESEPAFAAFMAERTRLIGQRREAMSDVDSMLPDAPSWVRDILRGMFGSEWRDKRS